MTNKSAQMTRRSRLAVVVSLGLAVAAAACSDGASTMTSPSGVSPSSLAANGRTLRAPGEEHQGLQCDGHADIGIGGRRNPACDRHERRTSGQSQQLGSVEIYVPSAFTIQSVSNLSNANWTSGVSGQTVRVGAKAGNQKLDGDAGRTSVTFDINVTSTECATYAFNTAQASNLPYYRSIRPELDLHRQCVVRDGNQLCPGPGPRMQGGSCRRK